MLPYSGGKKMGKPQWDVHAPGEMTAPTQSPSHLRYAVKNIYKQVRCSRSCLRPNEGRNLTITNSITVVLLSCCGELETTQTVELRKLDLVYTLLLLRTPPKPTQRGLPLELREPNSF